MGLEIDIAWLTVLLFGSLALLLALGLPMAFCTGSLAVIFLFVFGNPAILNMMPSRIFPFMTDYKLSAVQLFIFMAAMLEKAGIIEELFEAVYKWFGSPRAASRRRRCSPAPRLPMVGVVGATEVTMGMIALPAMLKRGYEPSSRAARCLPAARSESSSGLRSWRSSTRWWRSNRLASTRGVDFSGLAAIRTLSSPTFSIRCYINPKLGPALHSKSASIGAKNCGC